MTKALQRRFTWLPVVDRGCCCLRLETCCKVQGYFALIVSLLALGGGIYIASIGAVLYDSNQAAFTEGVAADSLSRASAEAALQVVLAFSGMFIIAGICGFIVSVLFLVGIYQRRPRLISCYVMLLTFFCISSLVDGLTRALILLQPAAFLPLIGTGLAMYMLICANSLLLKIALDDGAERGQQEGTIKGVHSAAVFLTPQPFAVASPPYVTLAENAENFQKV